MKITCQRAFSFIVISALSAGFTSEAVAAPLISWTIEPLGTNKYRVEFFADTNLPAPQAAGYTVTFTGVAGATIHQSLFNGAIPVETQSEGASFDGLLGYSLADDSWFDDVPESGQGISNNFGPTSEGANSFSGTFLTNSGAGQTFKSGRIAHLILVSPPTGGFRAVGNFAVAGLDFPFDTRIPEPATIASCGLTLLCLHLAIQRQAASRRRWRKS